MSDEIEDEPTELAEQPAEDDIPTLDDPGAISNLNKVNVEELAALQFESVKTLQAGEINVEHLQPGVEEKTKKHDTSERAKLRYQQMVGAVEEKTKQLTTDERAKLQYKKLVQDPPEKSTHKLPAIGERGPARSDAELAMDLTHSDRFPETATEMVDTPDATTREHSTGERDKLSPEAEDKIRTVDLNPTSIRRAEDFLKSLDEDLDETVFQRVRELTSGDIPALPSSMFPDSQTNAVTTPNPAVEAPTLDATTRAGSCR